MYVAVTERPEAQPPMDDLLLLSCAPPALEAFRQSEGQSRGSKVIPEDTAEGVLVGDPKHDHAAPIVPVKVNAFCNLHQVAARSAASEQSEKGGALATPTVLASHHEGAIRTILAFL